MARPREHARVDRTVRVHRRSLMPVRDAWVIRLQTAIVKQAADDLKAAVRAQDGTAAAALRSWFLSEWGQLLSFGQGEAIIRGIKKEEEEREQDDT